MLLLAILLVVILSTPVVTLVVVGVTRTPTARLTKSRAVEEEAAARNLLLLSVRIPAVVIMKEVWTSKSKLPELIPYSTHPR